MSRLARNIITLLMIIVAGLLVYFGPFYSAYSAITDSIYTQFLNGKYKTNIWTIFYLLN